MPSARGKRPVRVASKALRGITIATRCVAPSHRPSALTYVDEGGVVT